MDRRSASLCPVPGKPEPHGLPQAFLIGADFVAGEARASILGDNIFDGEGLDARRRAAVTTAEEGRSTAFAYRVTDPGRYWGRQFRSEKRPALSIAEKPAEPVSN